MYVCMYICIYVYMYICIYVCSQRVDPKQCVHATSVLQSFCNIFCIHYTHIYTYMALRLIADRLDMYQKLAPKNMSVMCPKHARTMSKRMPIACPEYVQTNIKRDVYIQVWMCINPWTVLKIWHISLAY